jgi:aminoacrylate hydrolase
VPPTEDRIVLARIAAILAFDRSGEIERIGHRTLVSAARDDAVTPSYYSEELARRIPGARLSLMPTGGHFYNHCFQAEFERLVAGFLLA